MSFSQLPAVKKDTKNGAPGNFFVTALLPIRSFLSGRALAKGRMTFKAVLVGKGRLFLLYSTQTFDTFLGFYMPT